MRRPLLIATLTLALTAVTATSAAATFPGKNGPIAFRNVDFDTGFGLPLFRAQPDGSQVTEISPLLGGFTDWRADGRRIAFEFVEEDFDIQIATMRPNGSRVRTLTSGTGIHEIPSWSPNGKRIVFDFSPEPDPSTPGFETRLRTMRADGSHARPLPMSKKGFDVEPRYSPNGKWIAFDRLRFDDEGNFSQAAFVVKTKGNHRVRRLTPWELNAEHPTWSPDGKWILFNSSPNGDVQVVRPSGRKLHTIVPASEGFGGHKPWFSPNGKRIVFMCENQGTLLDPPPDYNEDICTMKSNGTDIVHVIETPDTFENWPSWGPAPRKRR
jgi:TolB protein